VTGDNDREKKGFSGLSDLVSDIGKFDDQVVSKPLSEPETQPLSSAKSSEITSPLSESEQKNRETSQVKESVENDKTGRSSVRKWFWITVAVFFAIWFFSNEREGTKNTTHKQISSTKTDNVQLGRPTSDATKIKGQSAGLHYEKPPIGTNNVLSFSQICWCLREDIRIETMRNLIDTKEQIDKFNKIVDDYNTRCVEFRYRKGSLQRAQKEVEANRSQIISEVTRNAKKLSHSLRPTHSSVSQRPPRNDTSKLPNPQHTRKAQQLLTNLGYDPGPIDGQYGHRTANAVRMFQMDEGLVEDGWVDEELLNSLNKAKDALTSQKNKSIRYLTWQTVRIPEILTFQIPSTLELQAGAYKQYNDKAMGTVLGVTVSPDRVVAQPKGINSFEPQALKQYCRVIIETNKGQIGDFNTLEIPLSFSNEELSELNKLFKEKMEKDAAISTEKGIKMNILSWQPLKIVRIRGIDALKLTYTRSMDDGPPAIVNIYAIQNNDRIHKITISYRLSEKDLWAIDLEKVLNTFEFVKR